MNQDINVLALVKGTERYVFLYDDASRGRNAADPGPIRLEPGIELHLVRRRRAEPEDSPGQPQVVTASRFEVPLPSDVSDDEY